MDLWVSATAAVPVSSEYAECLLSLDGTQLEPKQGRDRLHVLPAMGSIDPLRLFGHATGVLLVVWTVDIPDAHSRLESIEGSMSACVIVATPYRAFSV